MEKKKGTSDGDDKSLLKLVQEMSKQRTGTISEQIRKVSKTFKWKMRKRSPLENPDE